MLLRPFDKSGAFLPTVPDGGALRRVAVRGASMTIAGGASALAIQVVSTVVLARLLTPRDFGLVAMVTTFSLLLMNFGLNGLTEAVVQRETIDNSLASNLFWINAAGGLALTVGFAFAGSLMARFYGEPLVAPIAVGVSASIFLTSISVMHLGLLKRAMRFTAVSTNDFVGRLISVLVSIVLGGMGWGYWALVVGACAMPASTAVGAWILCRWLPMLPRKTPGTGSMVRFAVSTFGRFSVNYVTRNTDNLLIGWRFGSIALGFYKKAYDLFTLPTMQLVASTTVVAVSALSRVKEDRNLHRQYLLGAMTVVAFLGMGLSGDLTLVGKDLIRLLLGTRWDFAGEIFEWFAPGIGIMIVYNTQGWIHLSIGRADRWLIWSIVEWAVTCLLFLASLPWGPKGMAVAWCVSFWVLFIPAMHYAGKPIGLSAKIVISSIWRYMAAALLAALGVAAVSAHYLHFRADATVGTAMLRVILISSAFLVLYVGSVLMLHGGLEPLRKMLGLIVEIMPTLRRSTVSVEEAEVYARAEAGPQAAHATRDCPLVSILIPAYNAEETIAETIRSAVAQTWEPKEIIVVDDGSTDETFKIARQYESKTVRVFTQRNQGATVARNEAFTRSAGEYIQWLDADDLLAPDKIAIQMRARDEEWTKRTLISSEWGMFMYRQHRAEFVPSALWCDLSPTEWLLRKLSLNLYMQTGSWLVSRELTEAAGPWDTRLLSDDDGEYFCRVLLASDGVRFVPEAKMYYRGPGLAFAGLSHVGQNPRRIEAHWLSMQLHIKYLRSLEESQRVRAACLRYLQTSLLYFYPDRPDIVAHVEQLAQELGGAVTTPRLSWKYYWLKGLLGWTRAKKAQQVLLGLRWTTARNLDKLVQNTWDKGPSEQMWPGKVAAKNISALNGDPIVRKRGQRS